MTKLTPELEAMLPEKICSLYYLEKVSERTKDALEASGGNKMRLACAETIKKRVEEVVRVEVVRDLIISCQYDKVLGKGRYGDTKRKEIREGIKIDLEDACQAIVTKLKEELIGGE